MKSAGDPDRWLARKAATPPRGRRRRFEALCRKYHSPVLVYVLRRTGTAEDAVDVIAEKFATA